MTLPSLAQKVCTYGLISCPLAVFFSFATLPRLDESMSQPITIFAMTITAFFYLATFLLWVLDWIILVRTWKTRRALLNVSCALLLIVGIFFGPYLVYFTLCKNLVPEANLSPV